VAEKVEGADSKRLIMKATAVVTDDPNGLSPRSRFQAAMILAMAADALQIFVFPLFAEGALSPADDVLDLAVVAVLVRLLGWHWKFLPAFAAELVPGVDLVPFWTIAVLNIYRKWKQKTVPEETRDKAQVIEGEYKPSTVRVPFIADSMDFEIVGKEPSCGR
jgi:hypothetical protein